MPTFLLAWYAAAATALQCAEPIPPEELAAAVDGAEKAWIDMDDQGFRDGLHTIAGVLLPCVGHAVEPAVAARVHLLMALQLQAAGDAENALASARAARQVAPDWVPPVEVLSPADPLRAAWEGEVEAAPTRKVPEPKAGSVAFDGENTRRRSRSLPTIAQVFDATGYASSTAYLGANEPMPAYDAIPRKRNLLLGCSVGAGALGVTTYAVAWNARSAMYGLAASTAATSDELDGRRGATNLFAALSTTLLAGATGCGVGAALIGDR